MILLALLLVTASPLRPTIRAERIQVRTTIQQIRQDTRQMIDQKRTEFKNRLGELRDAKKRAIAEKINTRRCEVIKNRTAAMTRHLQTMTNILARVEEKGGDVSAARSAIATAQSAVDALANADCGLTISGDDTALKSEVAQSLKNLRDQIKSVHDPVVAARKATTDAVRALAKVLNNPNE
ncbi:MAG: Uncharacterized protein G01um101416_935 [Microgenomates group bacterium Gr01-1014_16]|nr:MAG: Uncharacterized protein G01um101416_935 [Microgenomates group bacterium Gr01-1014_16]